MRPVAFTLAAALVLAGCSGGSPAAPGSTAQPAAPSPTGPIPTRIFISASPELIANRSRQLALAASYSDGSVRDVTPLVTSWKSSNPAIASVSDAGLVTGLAAGNVLITAKYAELETTFGMVVSANLITGLVRETNVSGPIGIWGAEVEIAGGPDSGRVVRTIDVNGSFRMNDLQAGDFDLIVRGRGYSTARMHVTELDGPDLTIGLSVAPGVVSDVLEGDVCFPTRTVTRVFTPRTAGFLRITKQAGQGSERALYANGLVVERQLFSYQDYELRAGTRYELRVSGDCDFGGPTGRINFLRPAE